MGRLRRLADATPAHRQRYVDLLRAVAIVLVVIGHWLITVIERRDGEVVGRSALGELSWAHPVTWLVQVIPIFFLVGGYANAASWQGRRRSDGDAVGWVQDRSGRLLRPTTVLLLVLAAAALVARVLGASPVQVRPVVWFATIPLWFLSAYLVVVLLTPPMYALHERWGFAVPAVLAVLVAVGDVARFTGRPALADGGYLFGWLAVHQLGFAWRTGALPARPRVGAVLAGAGLVALVLLTVVGPYPVAMLDVPGELRNASPPTVALLAAATFQIGVAFVLAPVAERWLRHRRPWTAVVAVNAVILTVFLWHVTAAILLIGALNAVDLLPTPRVDTAAWWLWRVPWLAALLLVLAALVAVFGPVETRTPHRAGSRSGRLPAPVSAVLDRPLVSAGLTVLGYAAAVYGLLDNNTAARDSPEPLGLPTAALVAYLAGAGVLRLLRSVPRPRAAHRSGPSVGQRPGG
jgi:hypothetical protein